VPAVRSWLRPILAGHLVDFWIGLRHAEEITLTAFQQRSWWARLMERAANVVMRLL
jgi:hypothetical protein